MSYQVGQALCHGDEGSLHISLVGAVAQAAAGVLAEVLSETLHVAGVAQGTAIVFHQTLQKLCGKERGYRDSVWEGEGLIWKGERYW